MTGVGMTLRLPRWGTKRQNRSYAQAAMPSVLVIQDFDGWVT